MKMRNRRQKRQTLPKLLTKSVLTAVCLSAAFAFGFQVYLSVTVRSQAEMEIECRTSELQQQIHRKAAYYDGEMLMQEICCQMAMYMNYSIHIPDPFGRPEKSVTMVPKYSPKCHAGAALIGENDEILASNTLAFMTHLNFSDDENDPARGWYICDREKLNLPQVDQLYADYAALALHEDSEHFVEPEIETAYVNRETHSFIPQKGCFKLNYEHYTGDSLVDQNRIETQKTTEFSLDLDLDGYELVTLHYGVGAEYPRAMLAFPQGEAPENLKQFQPEFRYRDEKSYTSGGFQMREDDTAMLDRSIPLYLGKDLYWLTLALTYNYKDPTLVAFYWRWTIVFAVLAFAVCLLWCWSQNTVNKSKYAFEDYQRDLTNHLAHDIKTPMTAIVGYTENLMEGQLTPEEQQRYLQSILDNVAFTDSIIRDTLYLNSLDGTGKPEREKLAVSSLLEEAFAKYALLLEKKQIRYSVQGSAEIRADRASFAAVIENLISNAVKYTPENGLIRAELSKKRLILTNTVAEKVSTKELKRPFFRGDEARSNTEGAGLGLSIAERAAAANGFALKLSCNETEFRAEVKF